jgi:gliding motility-associated-like protein
VTNGSCVTFDEVTITRFLAPTVASAGLDQTICGSSVLLNGNSPSVGTGAWSIITGSGTITNTNSANTNVSNLAPGANVFRWTISNGACPVSSDEVSIIRQIPPSPAVAGSDAEVCGSSINLSATSPLSGNGIWSLISGSGTLANPQSTTTGVSDLGAGANVFQWTTLNGNCPTSTDQVTILSYDNPSIADAGADITICGDSVVLNAEAPLVGIGQWSIIAGNGDIESPNAANSVVQNIPVGLLFLNWTVSNGVCPVSSDQVIVNAQVLSALADAGPDQEICGNVAELNGSESGSANALWTFLNGDGVFDQPQFPSVLAFTSFNGPQQIEYSISNGACISRDTIVLTTWQALSPVFAGTDTSLCVDSYVVSGTADDFASLVWTSVSAVIESPNNDTTAVSALLPGQNVITLTASNGTCPTQSDQVIITYAAPSEPATVMDDANLCSDSLLISASPDGGEWSILGSSGSIANSTESTTSLTNVSLGTTEVVYTITIGDCISSDTLQIVRSESPAFADAGPDQQICGQEAILAGNTPSVGVGTWIFIDNPAEISNVNDPNASLFAELPGLRAMAWSITNNFCTVSDTVEMIFLETPVSNGGPNVTACLNDTAYLQAVLPDFGSSYWNLITDNATIEDSLNPNTALQPVETGNAYLWWTVSNGACRDSDLVVVTILELNDPECLANEAGVFIPEGFSPNGDGKFDQFVIAGPSFKAIGLQVFDRYGNMVYESQNYQNDWSGVANQGNVLSGSQLAEGTYYYLVTVEGESEGRRGYVTLWR